MYVPGFVLSKMPFKSATPSHKLGQHNQLHYTLMTACGTFQAEAYWVLCSQLY